MVKKEIAALVTVLALGVFFRFYLITEIPPGLYPDEAANGNNAREALETGGFKVFYPENNGREGLFINLQAIAMWALGTEPWVLRLIPAIFGTLTILGIYLLAKEFFGNKELGIRNSENGSKNPNSLFLIHDSKTIALFSSFFLAVSYWHINFSRIGFRAILVPFFATFGMYFLLKGLRQGKIFDIVMAGIFTGLGFHTYIAFRFMPFVLLVPIFWYLWQWFKGDPSTRMRPNDPDSDNSSGSFGSLGPLPCAPCAVLFFIFIAFIVVLPLGYYFLQHPEDFLGRSGQVSIFSADSPLREYVKSNLLTLGMFFVPSHGDCNFRHNVACKPFLPIGILAAVGLIVLLRRASFSRHSFSAALMLTWLFFMSLPATLTREGLPHALRSIGMMPPMYLLEGLGVWWIIQHILGWIEMQKDKWPAYSRQFSRIKKEIIFLFALILVLAPIITYRQYFVLWANDPRTHQAFSADLRHIGEYLNVLPRETKKFVLVNPADVVIRGIWAPAQTPMFVSDTFTEEKRTAKNVVYVHSLDQISLRKDEGTAITPMNPDLKSEIQKRFPELRAKIINGFISFED